MNLPLPVTAMLGLGGTEIVLIFGVLLLLFGGAKLPGLARGLGQSIREFKKSTSGDEAEEEPKPTTASLK